MINSKMKMKFKVISMLLSSLILTSCIQKKTYLTEEEKKWNPYKKGQKIIFESNEAELDSIYIDDVLYQFPEGLGVNNQYEILSVLALSSSPQKNIKSKEYILSIQAKTETRESRIKFGISIKNAKFYAEFYKPEDKLIRNSGDSFLTPYRKFENVIVIESKDNYNKAKDAIKFLYWNNEVGYIGFEKFDGTIWSLKEIVY